MALNIVCIFYTVIVVFGNAFRMFIYTNQFIVGIYNWINIKLRDQAKDNQPFLPLLNLSKMLEIENRSLKIRSALNMMPKCTKYKG